MGMKKAEKVIKKRKLLGPLTVGVTSRKQGPVVRFVQVFAPLIVQADESNFSSLVQKLTGKQQAMAISQDKSSPSPSEENIQNISTSSALSCSVPLDLSNRIINDHQHAFHHHSHHFSFSLINDTALSPPTYTSSAGSFYDAASHNSDDDTSCFDFFDYHHLVDLPALPQVLDQEDEQWLESGFSNHTC